MTAPAWASWRNWMVRFRRASIGSFYWQLTLLATLGGFLFGYDTANIGSALPVLPYRLGDFAAGYLVAGASLGAAAGALMAGPLTDRFGRKSLLIADALLYAIGSLLSAFTPHHVATPLDLTAVRRPSRSAPRRRSPRARRCRRRPRRASPRSSSTRSGSGRRSGRWGSSANWCSP